MAPPAATKDWPAEDLHPAALLTCLKLGHTIRIPFQHPKLCRIYAPSRAYFTALVNFCQEFSLPNFVSFLEMA